MRPNEQIKFLYIFHWLIIVVVFTIIHQKCMDTIHMAVNALCFFLYFVG